jgi:hypothetical protein
MQTVKLKNSISQLSLPEQVVLLEDLLSSVKEKVFHQIENADVNQLRLFYRLFQLNFETSMVKNMLAVLSEIEKIKNIETLNNNIEKYSHKQMKHTEEDKNIYQFQEDEIVDNTELFRKLDSIRGNDKLCEHIKDPSEWQREIRKDRII